MRKKIVLICLLIAFIAGLIFANTKMNSNSVDTSNDVGRVISVNTNNFEQEVIESKNKVLIDFYADWCQPCKIVSPIIDEIASEEKNIKFVKVNIDENKGLANKYNIKYIPTLIVIKDGKEVNRIVGAADKKEIKEILK